MSDIDITVDVVEGGPVVVDVVEGVEIIGEVAVGAKGDKGDPGVPGDPGVVQAVVAGNNIDVDATDPANPIVSVETLTLADISDVTASPIEVNYTDGVTSPIQGQIDGKQASDADLTAIAALTPSNDDVIQRKAGAWTNRSPAQVKTDLALAKGDVGLGNVDNTSDANKPVSTAQATAIALKKTDSMSTNKLLGRGTAGTGAIEEITLGTNLSLSGTTLNATGGGGGGSTDVSYANITGSLPYRTDTKLDDWFTPLNSAPTTPVNMVIVGDSIAVSTAFGVTKPWGQRIVERFTSRGRTPIAEATWRFAYSTQVLGMTTNQGTLHSPAMGVGGVATDLTTGQKATMVATMDGISVVYSKQSGGGDLEVRDGAGGTLLTTISTAGTAKSSFIWTSSALTLASHTIEITSVGNTILEGVYVHNGTRDKGVRVWTAAKSGYTSNDFSTTPSLALDLLDNLNPELVVIATGTNDGAANYATYMAALIADVRTHAPNAAVAVWLPYYSSGGFNATELAAARAYLTSAPFLALDVPVIDGSVGTPNISTRYSADGIHPNDIGAEYIAQHIYSAIGGDPFGQVINYGVTNKVATDSLDTLKAPKATPTFTGLSTFDTISAVVGNFTVSNFFGLPYMNLKETGNTYSQFQVATAAFNNAISGFNGVGALFGSGSAVPDTPFWRSAVNQLQIGVNSTPGTLAANLAPIINAQTGTTYTLALGDAGKQITRSNASASTQDLPQNSAAAIPIGTIIPILNIGAGTVTFQAGAGATITGSTTITQHQRAFMTKTSTNGWNISVVGAGGVTASSTDTFTNKTIDANGTGNSISNLETADFATNVVDTNTLLTANSDTRLASQKATKTYIKSQAISIAPTSGDYYSMNGQTGAGTAGLTVTGKIVFHPLWLDVGTLDRIAVSTSVAAASTWRLGLYKANATTGLPDGQTVFLDAGTVDMNATAGVQAITINQAITDPGLYWAAVLVDAYTAQPTTHNCAYSSNTGVGILGLPQDMSSISRYRVGRSYGSTVATGSLPTAPTSLMTWAGTIPRVAVRYV